MGMCCMHMWLIYLKYLEKGPKIVVFLNLLKNLGINFSRISSIIKVYIICYILVHKSRIC